VSTAVFHRLRERKTIEKNVTFSAVKRSHEHAWQETSFFVIPTCKKENRPVSSTLPNGKNHQSAMD
jgi:hypothetical protein